MRLNPCVRLLGLVLAFMILPALSAAQDSIKCESNDGGRKYCGDYNSNQVRLERQISGAACVQGQSWGVDSRGLWVDRGCRAYFTVRGGGNWNGGGGNWNGGNQDSIKCESDDGGRKYCGNYNSNQVRLDRQISGAACVQGQSWGVDSRGLWVDRGCRAYFTVGGGGNWNGGGGNWNGGNQDSIKCESDDGGRKYCGDYNSNQVRLERQISGAACVQGQSWGVDSRGLWVDRGCRAYFTVGGSWGGGGWNPGGNVNAPSVNVSTSGRGNYKGPNQSIRVTRGYVDTRSGNPTVALSGQDIKVSFYGRIIRQNGDREFTLDIDGSDRGNANGTATFRLNSDHNEVESVNLNGRMNGRRFSGNFSR